MTALQLLHDSCSWFQVACLALFLMVFAGRTVQLRISKHINPITLNLSKKRLLGVAELTLLLSVNLWAVAVLVHALPIDSLDLPSPLELQLLDGTAVRAGGVLVIVAAFATCVLALAALGSSWRIGIDERQPGQLVTHGIYALSRNPIYLFFDLYFFGTFLINGTLLFLLFLLSTAGNLHYQILQEERFLTKAFGIAYEDYRTRTPRYFSVRHIASANCLVHTTDRRANSRHAVRAQDSSGRSH